jgi:hypothetical protein
METITTTTECRRSRGSSRIEEKFEEFLADQKPAGSSDFRFTDQVQYTEKDLKRRQELLELDLREDKADAQRKIANWAFASIIIFTGLLFTPMLPDSRITVLSDLLGMFYIAQATVVAAYFGFTTWMGKK